MASKQEASKVERSSVFHTLSLLTRTTGVISFILLLIDQELIAPLNAGVVAGDDL